MSGRGKGQDGAGQTGALSPRDSCFSLTLDDVACNVWDPWFRVTALVRSLTLILSLALSFSCPLLPLRLHRRQ